MGTHSHSDQAAETTGPKRLKPHQISLAIGIFMSIFIVVSGILPSITGWENDNAVHRTVFGGIPTPLKLTFTRWCGARALRLVRLRQPDEELGARRPRPSAHHAEEREASPGRLPRRRLHAHPAA